MFDDPLDLDDPPHAGSILIGLIFLFANTMLAVIWCPIKVWLRKAI